MIWHAVTHWPWSTIAAFAAAASALWVARLQTRERENLLGRQTVVEVMDAANKWQKEGARFLATVNRAVQANTLTGALNEAPLEGVTAAAAETDRALKTARMACNDFELLWRVAEAEGQVGAFLELITRQPTESAAEELARVRRTPEAGLQPLNKFGKAIEAFVNRGFAVYSPRRGLRFRWAQHRLNRQVKLLQGDSDE
jgi:leucyl aminopeptidase (aminopeptidase T)